MLILYLNSQEKIYKPIKTFYTSKSQKQMMPKCQVKNGFFSRPQSFYFKITDKFLKLTSKDKVVNIPLEAETTSIFRRKSFEIVECRRSHITAYLPIEDALPIEGQQDINFSFCHMGGSMSYSELYHRNSTQSLAVFTESQVEDSVQNL